MSGSHTQWGAPAPNAPVEEKKEKDRSGLNVVVITTLGTVIAALIATLGTVGAAYLNNKKELDAQPTVAVRTVTVTVPAPAGGSGSSGSDASASAGGSAPGTNSPKWLTDLNWQDYTNSNFKIDPGLAIIGKKKYPHSLTFGAQCNADTQGMVFAAEAGYSKVHASLGWKDTQALRTTFITYLQYTTDNPADSQATWTTIEQVSAPRSGVATISGTIPDGATAFKLYTSTELCNYEPTIADGAYS